jgi:hypothetical protein
VQFGEGVGNVFQKDETENNVLVLGGIHVVAEFVRSSPQSLLESERGPIAILLVCGLFGPLFRH